MGKDIIYIGMDLGSFKTAVVSSTGEREVLPSAVGFAAAAIVGLLLLHQAPLSISRCALGSSAIFLAFFVFNKQAFLNYYWLAGSFLPLAIMTGSAGETQPVAENSKDSAAATLDDR